VNDRSQDTGGVSGPSFSTDVLKGILVGIGAAHIAYSKSPCFSVGGQFLKTFPCQPLGRHFHTVGPPEEGRSVGMREVGMVRTTPDGTMPSVGYRP